MTNPWVDIIVKVAVVVIGFIADQLKDDKEDKKDDGQRTPEKK
jgi:hypothetical protein